jgi:hypothetical protein
MQCVTLPDPYQHRDQSGSETLPLFFGRIALLNLVDTKRYLQVRYKKSTTVGTAGTGIQLCFFLFVKQKQSSSVVIICSVSTRYGYLQQVSQSLLPERIFPFSNVWPLSLSKNRGLF